MAFMRVLCVFLVTILLSSACRDKVVCPAFQSTYILDDSTRMAYYSYAWQLDDITRQQYIASLNAVDTSSAAGAMGDSPSGDWSKYFTHVEEYVPPPAKVRKNKYGIVKYEPYWLKTLRMKTAPKENVLAPEVEIAAPIDEGEFFASDFGDDSPGVAVGLDPLSVGTDSLSVGLDSAAVGIDSLGAVPGAVAAVPQEPPPPKYRYRYDPEDNFNVEQDYYNKYYGSLLLAPPPRKKPQQVDSLGNAVVPDSLAAEQGFFSSLKNLFKKKSKEVLDEATEEALLEDDPPVDPDPEESGEEEGQEGGAGG